MVRRGSIDPFRIWPYVYLVSEYLNGTLTAKELEATFLTIWPGDPSLDRPDSLERCLSEVWHAIDDYEEPPGSGDAAQLDEAGMSVIIRQNLPELKKWLRGHLP